ncbi:hypothetical protein EGW08_018505 [Elysia chlorotica]|uniref:Uncharacterized protein n=1 Tax=Elysia chlorotica TaxID=188477 RepID=A0A3S0ZFH2_ELYCH|nr:hypothetical protein EGW08_018505 [Elysia chlorotica]
MSIGALCPAMSRGFPSVLTIVLVSAVLALLPQSALPCSPIKGVDYKEPTMAVKVANSPVVVSGKAYRQHDHPTEPTLYSMDFEVYCVFKGDSIKQHIRINNIGHIPGHCEGTSLTLNENYLVFLRPDKPGNMRSFTPTFMPGSGEKQYLDEAVYMCGATSKYPEGITDANKKAKCPAPNDMPEDCFAPPTTQGPPEPPIPDHKDGPQPPEPPTPDHKDGPPPPEPKHKPGNDAPYESVVDDSNAKKDGVKDSASSLLGSWLLSLCLVVMRLL